MLTEQVVNLADKLHIKIEEIDYKRKNKKCKDNTENYKNNFHLIYPFPSDVHIQLHRVHP